MPNIKDSDLTAVTSAVTSDLVAVTINPGSTPATRKITLANFLSSLFSAAFTFANQTIFSKPTTGSSLLYSLITSSTAIASTAIETAFDKTFSLSANTLAAGDVLRVRGSGKFSTTGTPTLALKPRIGGTALIVTSNTLTTPSGATDFMWTVDTQAIVRAIGGSGTIQRSSNYIAISGVNPLSVGTEASFTLNTTVGQTIDITALWGTSSPSNTITMDALTVEVLRPGASS